MTGPSWSNSGSVRLKLLRESSLKSGSWQRARRDNLIYMLIGLKTASRLFIFPISIALKRLQCIQSLHIVYWIEESFVTIIFYLLLIVEVKASFLPNLMKYYSLCHHIVCACVLIIYCVTAVVNRRWIHHDEKKSLAC